MSIRNLAHVTAKQAAFYAAQADQSACEAASTTLSNVRARHLQSEAAWRQLEAMTVARTLSLQADADKIEARSFENAEHRLAI